MSLVGLTPQQIAALTLADLAALTQADIASLTVADVAALSAAQIAAIPTSLIPDITPQQIGWIAPATFAALPPALLAILSAAQLVGVRLPQAAAMTAAQAAALAPAIVATLSVPQLNNLSVAALQALNGLTTAQLHLVTPAVIGHLSVAQFAAVLAPNLGLFVPTKFLDITAAQAATLTGQELNGLTMAKLQALSPSALAGISPAALAALRPALEQCLTAQQLNGMGAAALSALIPGRLTDAQIGSLTAATVASLSTAQFDALLGARLAALSVAAISGISIADLTSLTPAEAAEFSSAQIAAMSTAQANALPGQNPVVADLLTHESGGTLSYASALAVLQDAAAGGMTATKFAGLTQVANWLASGVVQASAYIVQAFSDVVLGNAANAWWTGGGSPVSLGDLSATSSQTQFNELIGKWLLGTDMPSLSGEPASGYQAYNLPLFSSAGPQLTDINQGEDGDCYFLAALASTAQQDPSLIRSMIQANGAGTYSVAFQVNGATDYVTVNNQLPDFNESWANGSNMAFANNATDLWVPLVEKAYAELMEQPDAVTYNSNANSYAAIDGGDSNGLTAITGQWVDEVNIDGSTSSSAGLTDLQQAQAALAAGNDVMVGTGGNEISTNWVSDHMFAVTAVNAVAETVTLYNPWGVSASFSGRQASFTASLANLEAEGVTLEYAVGHPATV
jgi:hypothetical protein